MKILTIEEKVKETERMNREMAESQRKHLKQMRVLWTITLAVIITDFLLVVVRALL